MKKQSQKRKYRNSSTIDQKAQSSNFALPTNSNYSSAQNSLIESPFELNTELLSSASEKRAENDSIRISLGQEKKPTQSDAGEKLTIPLGVGILLAVVFVGIAITISVYDVSDTPSGHLGEGELLGGTNSYIPSNDGIGSIVSEVWDILQRTGRPYAGGIGSLDERIRERIMESRRSSDSSGPSRADCRTAVKLLRQYRRLAEKYGRRLSPRDLERLDGLRDSGEITSNDLPGFMRDQMPGSLRGLTLNEIQVLCR